MKVKRVEKEASSVDSFISKFIIGQFEILRSQVQMSVRLCVRFFCGNILFVHVCTIIFISYNVLIPKCHAEIEFCILYNIYSNMNAYKHICIQIQMQIQMQMQVFVSVLRQRSYAMLS